MTAGNSPSPGRRYLLVADGSSIHTDRLAGALSDAGIEVHVAAFDRPRAASGLHFHRLRPSGAGDARFLFAVPQLRAIVRMLRPSVVHAHYISSYGVLAAVATSGPLVQTAWGTDLLVTARRPVPRRLARFALRRAALATGDSQSLLDEIAEIAPGTPLHRFVFGPPKSHFGSHRKDRIVLSPRNHEPNYRIELILDAWRLAQDLLPGHRLVIAGSGSMTAALRSRASDGVEFTGALPHADMLDIVRRSALVVSVPRSDATSAAVLEALAAGCAVTATDLDANREWLPPTHIVPVEVNAAGLAEALVRCVDLPLALSTEWSMESQIRGLLDATMAALQSAARPRSRGAAPNGD